MTHDGPPCTNDHHGPPGTVLFCNLSHLLCLEYKYKHITYLRKRLLQARIGDLTSINNNLTSIKNKLETELSTVHADLDEAVKELRAADERANRAQVNKSGEHE